MKNLMFIIFVLFASCGGAEPQSSFSLSNENDTIIADDFNGTFSIRDDSCNYETVNRFRIRTTSSTTGLITIIDAGNAEGYSAGDIFNGSLVYTASNDTTEIQGLGCSGSYVYPDKAQLASETLNLNVNAYDLVLICIDQFSADGACAQVFYKE